MKLLVPLMMPAIHSILLAAKPSRKDLMMGMPPATAASNITITFFAAAAAKISLPCSANSFLLAVTTCLPLAMACITMSLAMVVPPMSSTTISMSGWLTISAASVVMVIVSSVPMISCALAMSRRDTMVTRTSRPKRRLISSAFSRNTCAVPPPTTPKPIIPTLMGFMQTPKLGSCDPID